MNKAKTPMEQILHTAESTPTSSDPRWSDIAAKDTALTKIVDIARDEVFPAEKQAAPVEMNRDGDTLEDIKAALTQYRDGGVECFPPNCDEWYRLVNVRMQSWSLPVNLYCITAKHADHFDPLCMSFEVWHEAVIDRRWACRREAANGFVFVYDHIDGLNLSRHGAGSDCTYLRTGCDPSDQWTAIPLAEAPAGDAHFPTYWKSCAGSIRRQEGATGGIMLAWNGHEDNNPQSYYCTEQQMMDMGWEQIEPPPAKDASCFIFVDGDKFKEEDAPSEWRTKDNPREMTRAETAAAIRIIQAWLDGGKLQTRDYATGKWRDYFDAIPGWDWYRTDYRIAPSEALNAEDAPRGEQPPDLPSVAGAHVEGTLGELERRAQLAIGREQATIDSDNATIAVLCDTVRLVREYCVSQQVSEPPQPAMDWEEVIDELTAKRHEAHDFARSAATESNYEWQARYCDVADAYKFAIEIIQAGIAAKEGAE